MRQRVRKSRSVHAQRLLRIDHRSILIVVVFALSACTGLTSREPAPVGPQRAQRVTDSINLQGFPPEYQRGHTDGCAAVGVTPVPKPSGEAMYVQGWQDGYKRCSARRPN